MIEGFGGFGPKKVWWSQGPWHDEEYLDLIVDDLGSTIVRTVVYWDAEKQNDNDDPLAINWGGFDYGPESNNGKQFAFIRDLQAKDSVKLIASVWSPPLWMKQNTDNSLAKNCIGQCGGNLNPDLREEFAEYLLAYVLKLKQETGVDLYALSLQNEPIFANPFSSCVYTAEEYAELFKVVGARFADAGLATKFFGPEHMGDHGWNQRTELYAKILDDPEVAKYLYAYAVHGYKNGIDPDYSNALGWVQMYQRARDAGKLLWMSETSMRQKRDATWEGAWEMALNLHLALKYGKINAWIYWYFAGRMIEDNQPLPLFHLVKGWYKYVRPGFVQVESWSDNKNILTTAFKQDEKLTVVMINVDDDNQTINLDVVGKPAAKAFNIYRASEAMGGFAEIASTSDTSFILPGKSITTLVR